MSFTGSNIAMLLNKKVTVLGGSGFVGMHICNRLLKLDYQVNVITRKRDDHPDLLVLPNTRVIEGNVFDAKFLQSTLADSSIVINLIGILNEKGHKGEGFMRAHRDLPKTLIEVCRILGVRRYLHMSALNADATSGPSHYLRSKGEGENIVHTQAPDNLKVTSFQPSVIFGEEDTFFNRFAALLKITPVLFPLACPNARFAPVYVGDVADRFVNAIEDETTFGKRIPICGPDEYSLIELVRYTAEQLGVSRKIIGLPDSISKLQANIFEWLPGKPFSLDNYNSLKVDSVCSGNSHESTHIEDIVPAYIGNKTLQHDYDNYRKNARR